MTTTLRHIAKLTLPEGVREYIKCKVDRNYRNAKWRERGRKLSATVYQEVGGKVASGPFRGMSFDVSFAHNGILGMKLLGTYEMELHAVVEEIVARGYDHVLNLGAGDGYYAVGLARRLPQAKLVAFELMDKYQQYVRELAAANDVADRVAVRGACTAGLLEEEMRRVKGKVLVVCDIEGAEWDVLDPITVPQLKHVDMLVETHEIYRHGVCKELHRRFSKTHEVVVVHTRQRTHADFPAGIAVGRDDQIACMDEDRGHVMEFFWMKALNPDSSGFPPPCPPRCKRV